MSSSFLTSPPDSVAIIGAGLGGLILAFSLQKYQIPCKIYEMRDPGIEGFDIGGAIMLSPNALRVFDSLDVYQLLRTKGYNFETLTFKTDHDFKTTGTYYFGSEEMYGYKALRIYRKDLVIELQRVVQERGVEIIYGKKFSHIVSEGEDGVTFAFADGTTASVDLLVGVDGIHSKVRQYIHPTIIPKYAGSIGVTYAFPTSAVRLPQNCPDFPFPVSILGKNGGFIMAPQNPGGAEMFVGRQFNYPLQDRSGWDALLKTRTELIEMHQKDMSSWSDLVRSAQEQASKPDTRAFNIWPFHIVPHMESWASKKGRVVIMGDAAHAIAPTAGQGANQAAEDGLSFAILLKSLGSKIDLNKGLKVWQKYRMGRIEKVMKLNDDVNVTRLTEDERRELEEKGESIKIDDIDLEWLHLCVIEEDMAKIISKAVEEE